LHIDQTKTLFDLALMPVLEAQPCITVTTMGVRRGDTLALATDQMLLRRGEQDLALGQTHPERSACRAAVDRGELITRKFDFSLAIRSLWSFNVADHLLDRLVLELDGVFRSLHLLFSISVFDIIICLLIWGNASGHVNIPVESKFFRDDYVSPSRRKAFPPITFSITSGR